MTDSSTVPAPVAAGERIDALDTVRGFALLGVLIANINSSLPTPLNGVAGRFNRDQAWLDNVLEWFMSLFVDGRFYTMFSLLFGAGFVIFIDRARARGVRAESLFTRRLAALLLIGLAHALLIWYGDILVLYACLGLLLLTFVNMPWQRLWKWGLAFYAVPTVWYLIQSSIAGDASLADPAAAEAAREARRVAAEAAVAIYTSGTWWEVAQQRIADVLALWGYVGRSYGPTAFGMFLIGAAAVRGGLLNALHEHHTALRRLAWGGIPAGVALIVISRLPMTADYRGLDLAFYYLATLLQCLAYVAALLLLLRSERAARWISPLGSVGRMALTNYLSQSLVFTWIFCGYGLGIGDSLGRAATTAMAFAFFGLQIVFSRWWLARYRFGPMEWIWRTMTYGRPPSMRGIQPAT